MVRFLFLVTLPRYQKIRLELKMQAELTNKIKNTVPHLLKVNFMYPKYTRDHHKTLGKRNKRQR